MNGTSRLLLLGLAASCAAACVSWQDQADELQQSIDTFVANDHHKKPDFVAQYGPPRCIPVPAGETCLWIKPIAPARLRSKKPAAEIVRAVFDKDGGLVSAAGSVRHGKKTYRGLTEAEEEAAEDIAPGGCQQDEIFEYGKCFARSPGGASTTPNPNAAP